MTLPTADAPPDQAIGSDQESREHSCSFFSRLAMNNFFFPLSMWRVNELREQLVIEIEHDRLGGRPFEHVCSLIPLSVPGWLRTRTATLLSACDGP